MKQNNMVLLFLLVNYFSAWEHELTTDIIRKYQAPNDLLRQVDSIKGVYGFPVTERPEYFIKTDVSRIIGVEKLQTFFADNSYTTFKTPVKFLIPHFDKNGTFAPIGSIVISMRVTNINYLQNLSEEMIDKFLAIAEKTGIWDLHQRNVLQDEDGNTWFVDTQILEPLRENNLSSAAYSLLDDHYNFKVNGYTFSTSACKSLIGLLSHKDKSRFTSLLPQDMQ
jgi:hypothetical protein